jgi:hypothetical protein
MADKKTNLQIVLSATDKATQVINSAVGNANKKLASMQAKTAQLASNSFAVGRSMGMIGLAMGAPLISFVKSAEESATANARLEQVFKSMGDATGVAAEKARVLAKELQLEIGVDDEKILAAQAKLATFEKVIKNTSGTTEIFDRATRAAFDLQAAGFGDASSNVTQLGKALNNPIKGMTALTRSGITFNKAEEQKIKNLVASGKTLEAQRIILKAVETQVGGVAKATANDSDKMLVAFNEVKQQLGTALLPVLADLTRWVTAVAVPAISKFTKENGPLIASVLKIAAVTAGASLAISGAAFAFGGIVKVVSLSLGAFNMLVSGVGAAIKVFNILRIVVLANPIILAVTAIAAVAWLLWRNWDSVKIALAKTWEAIKWTFNNAITIVWGYIKRFTPLGLIINNWGPITGFFSNMWENIKGGFIAAVNFIFGIGKMFYDAGANIANSIWNGIKSGWTYITDGMGGLVQGIRDYLPFSPAKVGPLKDLHRIKFVETMMQGFNPAPAVNAVAGLTGAMSGAVSPQSIGTPTPSGGNGSSGGGVSLNYSPVINLSGGSEKDKQSFLETLNTHKVDILRMINGEIDKQNRKKY